MQATRLYLTTDDDGRIQGLPPLPPNAHLEAILLVIDAPPGAPARRKPSPRIAGLGAAHDDLIAPAAEPDDWEAIR